MIWLPMQASAAECDKSVLGFNAWYNGVVKKENGKCVVKMPEKGDKELTRMVWTIVLNVLTDLMSGIGYTATIFVVYGGFKYITSEGDPNKIASAKKILTSAVIGVVIAVLASVIVNTIISVITTQR